MACWGQPGLFLRRILFSLLSQTRKTRKAPLSCFPPCITNEQCRQQLVLLALCVSHAFVIVSDWLKMAGCLLQMAPEHRTNRTSASVASIISTIAAFPHILPRHTPLLSSSSFSHTHSLYLLSSTPSCLSFSVFVDASSQQSDQTIRSFVAACFVHNASAN